MTSSAQKVLDLAAERGILRPSDLDRYGIPKKSLYRLARAGRLERVGRGLYVLPGAEPSEHRSLAEAAKRVPSGVICLLTALRFHELTTQAPFEVWLAIDEKAWRPQVDYPPLRIVRFSGPALREGIEEHGLEGVRVRVYSPAKTVADCFKYRNKIGLDVALEALRGYSRRQHCSVDELWYYAGICRVRNVMRPYLEAVVG
ncbi:MAG: AbiEi antitoxin N-terminal domain-containing protein [Halochromatium sp.]|uniref:type IV toxin-antitoxin system AbiEi family antitoxin domain-containing protein n=1 Tax=Halochromatium sp. TaxID=2049430 RepID=UPI00397E406D